MLQLDRAHVIIFCLMFLLFLPVAFVQGPVDHSHFYSSHHMFEYAFDHGFQFGKDIVDNVGPFGFLHYPFTYTGGAYWSKIGWFVFLCLLLAYQISIFSQAISNRFSKAIFLLAGFYFPIQVTSTWFSYEVLPRLVVLFFALIIFNFELLRTDKVKTNTKWIVLTSVFYGFLLNQKISNLYIEGAASVLLLSFWLVRREFSKGLIYILSFGLSFISFWLIANQDIGNLPNFLRSSFSFSLAYQGLMVSPMLDHQVIVSVVMWTLSLAVLVWRIWQSSKERGKDFLVLECFSGALLCLVAFLSWKHGNLRNIASFGIFLFLMPVLLAWQLCYVPWNVSRHTKYALNAVAVALLVYLQWYVGFNNSLLKAGSENIFDELRERVQMLVTHDPFEKKYEMDLEIQKLKAESKLPKQVLDLIGNQTVDEFGNSPEIIFLNNLNYRPRPVPIKYIVVGKELNSANANYFSSRQTAPEFVFASELGSYFADAWTGLYIDINYKSIGQFKEHTILRKKPKIMWKDIRLELAREMTVSLEEPFVVELNADESYWFSAFPQKTKFEEIVSFFFKPNSIYLEIESGGMLQIVGASPLSHAGGFVINRSLLPKQTNAEKNQLQAKMRFLVEPKFYGSSYMDKVTVKFSRIYFE